MNLNQQVTPRAIPSLSSGERHRQRMHRHVTRGRIAERTRIAQELHDTLFQGFLAASLQMQAAVNQLPDDSAVKPRFGSIAALMSRVIEEGRRAVQGLRMPREGEDLSLARALAAVPGELGLSQAIRFRVAVMGDCIALNPLHWENVYRICRESIINAYRHSGGSEVDAELQYRGSGLRVVIRDNGRGIDGDELRQKQENHWGLRGMRERAERIGARLSIMSGNDLGTEVELFLPAVSGCPAPA